ncbi:MAG: hypothetical protein Q9170_003133 [Blastenia crenularia]
MPAFGELRNCCMVFVLVQRSRVLLLQSLTFGAEGGLVALADWGCGISLSLLIKWKKRRFFTFRTRIIHHHRHPPFLVRLAVRIQNPFIGIFLGPEPGKVYASVIRQHEPQRPWPAFGIKDADRTAVGEWVEMPRMGQAMAFVVQSPWPVTVTCIEWPVLLLVGIEPGWSFGWKSEAKAASKWVGRRVMVEVFNFE